MISIEKFKQLLGSEAQNLTDKEIEQIRDSQYQLADIAFDMWYRNNNKKTFPKNKKIYHLKILNS